MKYCPRCGVELAEDATRCVLCGQRAITEKPGVAEASGLDYPAIASGPVVSGRLSEIEIGADAFARAVRESLNESERSRVAVELLSVCLGGALLMTCLMDIFANRAFTWSLFSSLGIISAWMLMAMPLILRGYRWILYAVLAPYLVLAMFLLFLFSGRLGQFVRYGLPIALTIDGIAAGIMGILAAFRRKGLNALAVILCAVATMCILIEIVVDLNTLRSLALSWSVIVTIALVPAAGLLFFLHYRIVDQASLRKLFRL